MQDAASSSPDVLKPQTRVTESAEAVKLLTDQRFPWDVFAATQAQEKEKTESQNRSFLENRVPRMDVPLDLHIQGPSRTNMWDYSDDPSRQRCMADKALYPRLARIIDTLVANQDAPPVQFTFLEHEGDPALGSLSKIFIEIRTREHTVLNHHSREEAKKASLPFMTFFEKHGIPLQGYDERGSRDNELKFETSSTDPFPILKASIESMEAELGINLSQEHTETLDTRGGQIREFQADSRRNRLRGEGADDSYTSTHGHGGGIY